VVNLEERLEAEVKKGKVRVPPSPVVALRLMELLADDKASLMALKATLEKDQGLAAVVLRLANSARYRWASREVTTLQQAIVVLGRKVLKEVSVASELHERMLAKGPLIALRRRAWREALVGAQVASWVSAEFRAVADEAFVAGLLHDIGRVPAIGVLEQLLREPGVVRPSDEECWRLIERHHVELGALLARTWGLPRSLVTVISSHHASDESTPVLEAVRVGHDVVRLLDSHTHVGVAELGVIANLSTAECERLVSKLASLPDTLDAFREPGGATGEEPMPDFELQVDDDEPAVRREVLVFADGAETSAKVMRVGPRELAIDQPLGSGRVVLVRAGTGAFYAVVQRASSTGSELTPWALDGAQLTAWNGFVQGDEPLRAVGS